MIAIEPVQRVPLARLKPAPWNPRLIRDARFKNLCRSLEADPDFMERRPVLAMADGTIYAGNMRFRAAEHLRWQDIPAVVEDVPERLAKERALRDNAQWGEWQDDDLAALVYELSESGADLDLLGFELPEIDRLLQSVGVGGSAEDPGAEVDRADELREKWQTDRGQLWVVPSNSVPGRAHRLLCGDSTSAEDVARLMGGERAAMLFTDPPYGISYRDTGAGAWDDRKLALKRAGLLRPRFEKIEGDDLRGDELAAFLVVTFSMLSEACLPSGGWYVWHAANTQDIFAAALSDAGYEIRAQIIWAKSRPAFNFAQYKYQHEPCFYAFRHGQSPKWYGDNAQTTLWDVASESGSSYDHPTQKPAGLALRAMSNSSQAGDIVLDAFLGSGATMVAAEQTGRLCYGMEIEPKYVAVAIERLAGMGLEPRLAA